MPTNSSDDMSAGKSKQALRDILRQDNVIARSIPAENADEAELFVIIARKLDPEDRTQLLKHADCELTAGADIVQKMTGLQQEIERLRRLSLTDELTGLYNYRYFSLQLSTEMSRTRRTGSPVSLMIIDVDNFKLVNDRHGHAAGNDCLAAIADMIRENLRTTDIACRYGGDEFAIIMPATHHIDALLIARRLKESMETIRERFERAVSLSIGIAEYTHYMPEDSSAVLESADASLYEAKQNGKNQIFVSGRPEAAPHTAAVSRQEKEALFKKVPEK